MAPRSILLWMDTLCIPPSKSRVTLPDKEKVKMIAIASMNSIYAEATATLVFDPELEHFDSPLVMAADHLTIASRIDFGGWRSRAWVVSTRERILLENLD